MKIIASDNYARESVADRLVAENIKSEDYATAICEALQAKFGGHDSDWFFVIKSDDYKLWRGIEELV